MSLEIFATLGIVTEQQGTQLVAECPVCGKKKFYIDPRTTKWDCKVCAKSGNDVTILAFLHEELWRPALGPEQTAALSKYRDGLPSRAFELGDNPGYNFTAEKYTWLIRKPTGIPSGVRTFVLPKPGKKNAVHQLKGTPLGLLGAEALADKNRQTETVYICEGEWDWHAMLWLLEQTKKQGIPLGLPGASTFSQEWIPYLQGRTVVGLYDNDDPGRRGTVRCWEKNNRTVRSLKFLHWDDERPEGFDLHDLVLQHRKKPQEAWTYIEANLEGAPTGELPAGAQTSQQQAATQRQQEQEKLAPIGTEELHAVYRKWLKLENTDLLDVAMGVLWTAQLPGNPLWMFIVAPPSSSKSETLMPLAQWWRCFAMSTVTARGLISGMQGVGGTDPSVMAELDGNRMGVIIKDLTPLLQTRREERDEVFSILRDAYDGSCTRAFGNGIRREYKDINFAMLAGVTPVIDAMSTASMGERFLKFRSDRELDRRDEEARAIRAIQNVNSLDEMRAELVDASVRALQRPFDPADVLSPDGETMEFVARLAQLVAWMRGSRSRDEYSDRIFSRPIVESSPRLALQFTKLAQGLALHFEADRLSDPRIMGLLRRIALHTADVISTAIVQVLWCLGPVTRADIANKLREFNFSTLTHCIENLMATRLLVVEARDGIPHYLLAHDAERLVRDTGIYEHLPATDPYYRSDLRRARLRLAKAKP